VRRQRWAHLGHSGASRGAPSPATASARTTVSSRSLTRMKSALQPGVRPLVCGKTADYSRAVLTATQVPPSEIETLTKIRLGRQEILTRDETGAPGVLSPVLLVVRGSGAFSLGEACRQD